MFWMIMEIELKSKIMSLLIKMGKYRFKSLKIKLIVQSLKFKILKNFVQKKKTIKKLKNLILRREFKLI